MPVATRPPQSYPSTPKETFTLDSFIEGYNSYAQSQSEVGDTQVPRGKNCLPDNNGAMKPRLGKASASPLFPTGYKTAAIGRLKNSTVDVTLALHGDKLYKFTDTTLTTLTGATFTPSVAKDCKIIQSVGRAYVFNGVDQPYYTSDGATLTMQTDSFPLKYVVEYKQRLYGVRPQYPDRLYFSNTITDSTATTGTEPASYAIGNFGTFSVDLTLVAPTPVKNAGFIQFELDGGVEITGVSKGQNSTLVIETATSGKWSVSQTGISPTAKTVIHDFSRVVQTGGCPSPLSIFTSSDNQQRYYGGDNYYMYGELKNLQTPQPVPKSGRVDSEMKNIPGSTKADIVGCYFNSTEYVFYTAGGYNDRCIAKNTVLSAWSTPYSGWNVSCVLVVKQNGRDRLLAGSSNINDPRIYELEVGTDDAGVTIDAWFADKNTNFKLPGIPKKSVFGQVHYSEITGSLQVEVYVDGKFIKSYTFTAPGSLSAGAGVGTEMVGVGMVGVGGDAPSFSTRTVTDSFFPVTFPSNKGERVQFLYRKGTADSTFRIAKRSVVFKRKKATKTYNPTSGSSVAPFSYGTYI